MAVTDFIALDVETANSDFASICAIGLAHFRGGEVFKSLTILVDPEDDFSSMNIGIHGIRPKDVIGKPTMAKIFPVISSALADAAIVHHSPFDRTALARAAAKYGAAGMPCTWVDSCQIAKRVWPEFKGGGGHGLAHLCDAFSVSFTHHDAAEDARAAGLIVQRAIAKSGIPFAAWVEEIGYLSTSDDAVPRRINAPIYASQKISLSGIDGGPMDGETVVFTGSLTVPRLEAAQLAAAAGCDVEDGVNKRTTILVVGDQDLRATKGQEKSLKHRKVETMIAKGAIVRIVRESDFMLMVR